MTNYAQWESPAPFEAMLANPLVRPYLQATNALATAEHLYEVVSVHHAAGDRSR